MRYILLTATLLFATNCQSPRAFLEEHRSQVETKLKAASAIAAKIKVAPPFSAENVVISGRTPLVFSRDFRDNKTGGNAQIVDLWDIENPGKDRGAAYAPVDASWFHDTYALLTTGRFAPNKYHPEGREFDKIDTMVTKNFQRLETMQYLIVLKVLSYKRPQIVAKSLFSPGHLKGEVHVYAIDNAAPLGGFTFEAQNEKRVSHSGDILSDAEALHANLWRNARHGIRGKIKQYLNTDVEEVWY